MPSYDETRLNIQSGDLLAWSTRGCKSMRDLQLNIVRAFTRSEYDHVAIAWVVGGRVFVIEATPPLVRIYPLAKLTPFYHVPMDIAWKPEYDEYLLAKVGEKYSVWQAIVSYFTKPRVDREWQCAELVVDFWDNIGLCLECDITPSGVVEVALDYSRHGMTLVHR